MSPSLILYAPNVHTGGGLVLLRALLREWPAERPLRALLDDRGRTELPLPHGAQVEWVRSTPLSRLSAEFLLRSWAEPGSRLLCFHGLPPLLPSAARVTVFQQNRNYLGLTPLRAFKPRTALRLGFERLISRLCRRHVAEYIVQTPSMARALRSWHGGDVKVGVLPFAEPIQPRQKAQRYDFIYVADGEAHKNHAGLLNAWRLLAAEGIFPSLALTLSQRDAALRAHVETLAAEGLAVQDLGQCNHAGILDHMAAAGAVIFPSLSESFGLPLIEARQLGLPIVASELDFVRDVCVPAQTFDPHSPVSIARAVRRQLGKAEAPLQPLAPRQLWSTLDQGER